MQHIDEDVTTPESFKTGWRSAIRQTPRVISIGDWMRRKGARVVGYAACAALVFAAGAGEWGEVTREQTSAVDMTDTYTDNASRLESARAKKRQLDALYEKAETMEDIITLTDAIFDVQEEIEWLEGQNRRIDNQASMATLYVTINEKSSAVSAKQPFFTRLGRQLADGWENFGEFVSNAVLGLTYALPWAAVAAAVIALARCWIRKKKKQ